MLKDAIYDSSDWSWEGSLSESEYEECLLEEYPHWPSLQSLRVQIINYNNYKEKPYIKDIVESIFNIRVHNQCLSDSGSIVYMDDGYCYDPDYMGEDEMMDNDDISEEEYEEWEKQNKRKWKEREHNDQAILTEWILATRLVEYLYNQMTDFGIMRGGTISDLDVGVFYQPKQNVKLAKSECDLLFGEHFDKVKDIITVIKEKHNV